MDSLKKEAETLAEKVSQAFEQLKLEDLRSRYDELQAEMAKPEFWQDQKRAAEVSKESARLLTRLEPWDSLRSQLAELSELMAISDSSMQDDISRQLSELNERYESLRQELSFTGPYDDHSVILNIYAGAGGTDAQDWAQMLERMYLRWAEKSGLKVEVIEESPGEEAGIKSATLEISGGNHLYGKLAGEHGVHRLVRKSPFNAAGSRETSFARVEVLPAIEAPDEVKVEDKDLRIDVFRAGGHGGQSVNTTDSAVRITHIPTGITVTIQNERSQLQNRETALTILRSRLAQMQLEQHIDKLEDLKGPDKSNEWGSQIRNYILDDRIVKDLRTGFESHNPQKILDGDLDPLIDAWLTPSI
ncbi:MAG TPA: peptide chain release factor 2 [Candidatus Saccharimonadales bacterium]|nr:peptide chain release factor 2 [Candidatus Saccharimonadales bacterium]